MLIIRGATYTPSGNQQGNTGDSGNTGDNGNNDTPSVNPNPQPSTQAQYKIYYRSGDTMLLDRPTDSAICAVAILVADPLENGIVSVSADTVALQNAGAQAVVGCNTALEKGGESFTFQTSDWTKYVDMVQSGTPYTGGTVGVKTLMIVISKSSYTVNLSTTEVDAIVAAIPTAITFDD